MTIANAEFAPAKVNLFLHVVGRRADGMHELQSLFVFASIGDRITAAPANKTNLSLSGPFARGVAAAGAGGESNLVLKAARLLENQVGRPVPPVALSLEKNLPVASGIGGGSADAAATLRTLTGYWDSNIDEKNLQAIALQLGADVPACLVGSSAWVEGVGERIRPITDFPEMYGVLVNPLVAVSTAMVFANRAAQSPEYSAPISPWLGGNVAELIDFLGATGNDLERSAIGVAPEIADAVAAIRQTNNCIFARMSGSGATCFGLFLQSRDAIAAAQKLSAVHTGWWIQPVRLGSRQNCTEDQL